MKKPSSIRQRLLEMGPSDSLTFTMDELTENTARNYASALGLAHRKIFAVHRDRKARTLTIERIW